MLLFDTLGSLYKDLQSGVDIVAKNDKIKTFCNNESYINTTILIHIKGYIVCTELVGFDCS